MSMLGEKDKVILPYVGGKRIHMYRCITAKFITENDTIEFETVVGYMYREFGINPLDMYDMDVITISTTRKILIEKGIIKEAI